MKKEFYIIQIVGSRMNAILSFDDDKEAEKTLLGLGIPGSYFIQEVKTIAPKKVEKKAKPFHHPWENQNKE